MLEMIPETTVTTMARCSGHAGTWGVKKEFHKTAIKIGRPVFKQMAAAEPDYIASDCRLAGHHIQQRISQLDNAPAQPTAKLAHPLTKIMRATTEPRPQRCIFRASR